MTSGLVAVTGATGFLGRRLIEQLRSDGWRVRILVRSGSRARALETLAWDAVTGDLSDSNALNKLVNGADAVVHVAGLIKARDRDAFFTVNEAGARRLARVCGGRRLIHVSSLVAREPHLSDYAASKRAGEDAVREIGGSTVTVVRPPVIYGPGDRETLSLFKMAGTPVMFAPGNAAARLAIAEVGDVAAAIADLLASAPGQPTITIGGDRPSGYSWREIFSAAAEAVDNSPAIVVAPEWLLTLAGSAFEAVGRLRRDPPIFTPGKAREALHSNWSVSAAEAGESGGRQYTSLADGFARTVAWYRSRGWLR